MLTFEGFMAERASIRGVSAKAFEAENKAYRKLKTKLRMRAFQSPAGADAGFPDFGFSLILKSGRRIDAHIEYKASAREQMGSMRDWIFDGSKFITPDKNSNTKQELIALMNGTSEAKKNGKRLLGDLKKYVSRQIVKIYSGSLTVIKDKETRKTATREFAAKTKNFTIAKISDKTLGNKIIDHYKTKFRKNLKAESDAHILMMMLGNELWYIDTIGRVSAAEMSEMAAMFGVDKMNKMTGLVANLEVRIQPRGLNSPSKPASIDVMANFRLGGKPTGGVKVI